ncbi:hypothetical protein D3C78_806050 [compost metagenome]
MIQRNHHDEGEAAAKAGAAQQAPEDGGGLRGEPEAAKARHLHHNGQPHPGAPVQPACRQQRQTQAAGGLGQGQPGHQLAPLLGAPSQRQVGGGQPGHDYAVAAVDDAKAGDQQPGAGQRDQPRLP